MSSGSVQTGPISTKTDIIGSIAFYHHSKAVRCNAIQIDFVNKLSMSLSLALENVRLFRTISESESKYRGLFDNLQEVVALRRFIYDSNSELIDMELVDVNPAALRVYGVGSISVGRQGQSIYGPSHRWRVKGKGPHPDILEFSSIESKVREFHETSMEDVGHQLVPPKNEKFINDIFESEHWKM